MCAVAVAASCSPALAQQAAPAAAASPAYLNTERGLRVKTLEGRAISPSLMKGMRPEEQITKRTPGVPTRPSVLLQHEGGTSAPGLEWFVARPLKMMPYLDSSYVFGNTSLQIRHYLFRPVRIQLHGADGRRPERKNGFPLLQWFPADQYHHLPQSFHGQRPVPGLRVRLRQRL